MKLKKGQIIIASSVLVILIVGLIFYLTVIAKPTTMVSCTEISRSNLIYSIRVNGIVESVEKKNVYSKLDYKVETVAVEVGNQVEAGQILCQLDTEELKLNIAQQKAELEVSKENSLNQLQESKRVYNEAQSNLNGDKNSQVQNAESALKTAKINLKNSQNVYDNAVSDLKNHANSQIQTAESKVTAAKLDFENQKDAFERSAILLEMGDIADIDYELAETAYINAQDKYEDALASLETAKTTEARDLEYAKTSLENAIVNYNTAKDNLSLAQQAATSELSIYESNAKSAEISTNMEAKVIAIELLEKKLADSTIVAPISGTVTSVLAKEGGSGAGLLFVIEDTEHLKVVTKVDEFDVAQVQPGAEATIEVETINNDKYSGIVSMVNPAALKDATGKTVPGSVAEFETEVKVLSDSSGLKIGKNAEVTIILGRKENVFYVPHKAVTTDKDNQSVIFILTGSESNKGKAKQIAVDTGMKSDVYIEISSDELTDGMKVIDDASTVRNGLQVSLK